jgi:hypothetical protein
LKSCKDLGCVCFECIEINSCVLFECPGKSAYPECPGRSECPLLETEKKNKTGAELIADERKRQIEVEGWSAEHDDQIHRPGDLALAGAVYALHMVGTLDSGPWGEKIRCCAESNWPWDSRRWKPTPEDPIRQLAKAGALIAAAIDRLQRLNDRRSLDA